MRRGVFGVCFVSLDAARCAVRCCWVFTRLLCFLAVGIGFLTGTYVDSVELGQSISCLKDLVFALRPIRPC